jgi:hypothetical protein
MIACLLAQPPTHSNQNRGRGRGREREEGVVLLHLRPLRILDRGLVYQQE